MSLDASRAGCAQARLRLRHAQGLLRRQDGGIRPPRPISSAGSAPSRRRWPPRPVRRGRAAAWPASARDDRSGEPARPRRRLAGAAGRAAPRPPAGGDGDAGPGLRGRDARPADRGLDRRRDQRQCRDRRRDASSPRALARPGAQQRLRGEGGASRRQQSRRHRHPAAGQRSGDSALDETTDKLWARFAESCDADGLTDFSGLQALVVRAMVESGECLVRHPRPAARGRAATTAAAPAARARSPGCGQDRRSAGRRLRHPGRRVRSARPPAGLLALSRSPGRSGDGPPRLARRANAVPAPSVLHLFDRLRPGQVRGAPWFAPVILKLRDLDDYDDAELVRKKIEACFAAFVTGADDEETLGASADRRRGPAGRELRARDDRVPGAGQGREVRDPRPRRRLRRVSCGSSSTPSPPASGSPTSCSPAISARSTTPRSAPACSSSAGGWRRCNGSCWCRGCAGRCGSGSSRRARPSAPCRKARSTAEWTAPRFEAVDPLKDIQADILAVRAGLMTLKEAIARQGYDPAQVLAEIGETNAALDAPRHRPRHRSAQSDQDRRGEAADGGPTGWIITPSPLNGRRQGHR